MAKFQKLLATFHKTMISDEEEESSEASEADNEDVNANNNTNFTCNEVSSSNAQVEKESKIVSDEDDEDGESSEYDSDGFYFHVPLPEDECKTNSWNNMASCSTDELKPKLSAITIEDKGEEISFNDVYVDISKTRVPTSTGKCTDVDEIMKKSAMGPGFEQLKCVVPFSKTKRELDREKRKNRLKTKGDMWFNMPAAKMTPELRNDLKVLKMRSVLDPKHFYKKNLMNHDPRYFQVGTVVESPVDFYSSRVPKKQRKKTMVDELLADAEFQSYNKQRYREIIAEKKKTTFRAFKHAKRLKKNKGKGRK